MLDDISSEDIYPDSVSRVEILRGSVPLHTINALVHWASNVGFYMHLKSGGLLAVYQTGDDTYRADIPGGEQS